MPNNRRRLLRKAKLWMSRFSREYALRYGMVPLSESFGTIRMASAEVRSLSPVNRTITFMDEVDPEEKG